MSYLYTCNTNTPICLCLTNIRCLMQAAAVRLLLSITLSFTMRLMRAGRLDEAGVLAVRIGNDITRQNKVVSSTQAAKQTLKVSGPPLDNLRVGSVMMNLWTASPLNHSILTMYSLPLLHTTLRPLQSSQSLILSTNYIYMYVCMRKLAN